MGMPELLLIFVIALLVFGPKKLPEIGKSLGRAMSEFKRSSQEFKDNLESEVETDKIKQELVKQQDEIKAALESPKPAEAPKPGAGASPNSNAA
jgi:sec-independent protein translocase protein TatA